MKNVHKDHRKRLRAQFDATGAEGMSDFTFLELVLFYAVPRSDTNPLAHRLIERFGSFDKVLRASKSELMQVDGVGESIATYLTLFLPAWKRAAESRLKGGFSYHDSEKFEEFIKSKYINLDSERAMIIHFDGNGDFINFNWLAEGAFSRVEIDKRRIVSAIAENKSTYVAFVHNHPSGVVSPSSDDIEALDSLRTFLRMMNVYIIDNIIYTESRILFFSRSRSFSKFLG